MACSLIGQGFQTAYYCLFDVLNNFFYILNNFFYIISLRVAPRKRWTAHYAATLFCLLEDYFEVHAIRSLSIGKDLCKINIDSASMAPAAST